MKHLCAHFRKFYLGFAGLIIGFFIVQNLNAADAGAPEAGNGLKAKIGGLIESRKEIKLSDFGDFLAQLEIPQAAIKLFDGVVIKTPTIVKAPEGFKGFSVTGSVLFDTAEVKAKVSIVDLPEIQARGFIFTLELPKGWKLTSLFPKLDSEIFRELSLPEGQFILSSFVYEDPELDLKIKEGLNFIAGLDLTGPFEVFGKFVKNKAKMPEAFVFEGGDLKFHGVIPRDISKTTFTGIIPFRIGVDFTKIEKMPKSITNIIKKITSSEFVATIDPPPNAALGVGGSIEVTLGMQTQPLVFGLKFEVEPTKLTAIAFMEEKLEMKWLALSDVGFQMEWDDALIGAAIILGIPFTGVGLRGTLYLGKEGDKRASIDMAALARVQSGGGIDDFMFIGEAKDIRISDFLNYLMKISGIKASIAADKIPLITLNELSVYAVPLDTTVAEEDYKAGVGASADVNIMGIAGGLDFQVNPTLKVIEGEGHLSSIRTKVIELTGIGTEALYGVTGKKIKFDGPEMKMLLSLTKPEDSMLKLGGALKIPAINVSQKVDLFINPTKVEGSFETRVANLFDVDMALKLDLKAPENFSITFSFTKGEADFAKLIQQGIAQATEPLNAKIAGHRAKIARLKKQVADKKAECDKLKKDWYKIFIPWEAAEAAKKYEACFEVALKEIEKELHAVEIELTKFTSSLLDAISKLADALNTVELKSASGEINGVDLGQGKLPKVSMELYIKPLNKTISIKDAQFDFKNPISSAKFIGEQVINVFK